MDTREVVYLISRQTLEQLQALGLLQFKRQYWVIESRLHHCLDVSMQEDLSRVRTPNSALVLGMIRRVVLGLSNAAVDKARKKNPKTKFNTKSFRQRFLSARGGRERLQALIFAQHPAVLDLEKRKDASHSRAGSSKAGWTSTMRSAYAGPRRHHGPCHRAASGRSEAGSLPAHQVVLPATPQAEGSAAKGPEIAPEGLRLTTSRLRPQCRPSTEAVLRARSSAAA